ncbi:MAG: hypothetical protein WCI47_00350 [bacterium]
MNEVHEVVDVLAVSKKGQGIVVPIIIKWKNRYYRIREIGLTHPKREGRILHHIFEGTDGNLTFRLNYNTESLQWTLEATSDGLP